MESFPLLIMSWSIKEISTKRDTSRESSCVSFNGNVPNKKSLRKKQNWKVRPSFASVVRSPPVPSKIKKGEHHQSIDNPDWQTNKLRAGRHIQQPTTDPCLTHPQSIVLSSFQFSQEQRNNGSFHLRRLRRYSEEKSSRCTRGKMSAVLCC